jgi:quercetin dioxygenase-like cupin family protein
VPNPDVLRVLSVQSGETITEQERRNVLILADGPELTITWTRYASGEDGPDLHVHREHTDAVCVLDGALTFPVGPDGAERVSLGPGGFAAVPPNVVHTFVNDSGGEARWLNFHAPDEGFAASLRGRRDGSDPGFDSFDPPAGGGLPAVEVVVGRPGAGERTNGALVKAALDGLYVAELDAGAPRAEEAFYFELAGGRLLEVRTVRP